GNRIVFRGKVVLQYLRVAFRGHEGTFEVGGRSVVRVRADVFPGATVRIGRDCVFNKIALMSAHEKRTIHIGDGCLFADPFIRTSDMHGIYDAETGARLNLAKNVTIMDRVWIADRA